MAGGSLAHSRFGLKIGALLSQKLVGRECESFNSDMRIKVSKAFPYRYPDASVVGGEPVFDAIGGQVMLVNPVIISKYFRLQPPLTT